MFTRLAKKLINHKILVFLTVLLSLFLRLYGIQWGVPDRERTTLVFEEDSFAKAFFEEMQKSREEIYEKIDYWNKSYTIEEKNIEIKLDGKKILVPRSLIDASRSYLIRSYGDDEQHTLTCIGNMNPAKLDFNPKFFSYGGAYLYPVAAGLKVASAFKYINLSSDIKYYFSNPDEMGKLFIVGRAVGALLCGLATYLIFLVGFNLYSFRAGLIAALLFSLTPGLVIFSHYLKPSCLEIFWSMLSFYCSAKILKEDKIKFPLLAGLFAGFAAGAIPTNGFVLLFIPIAYLISGKNKITSFKGILGAFFLFVTGFLITNPYWIFSIKQALSEYGAASEWWKFTPTISNWLTYFRNTLSYTLGWPVLISVVCGIIYTLYKKEKQGLFMLFLLLPMYIYFASSTTTYAHYGFCIVPFFILLAARFFDAALSKTNYFKNSALIFLIFTTLYTFSYSFSYDKIFAQKNIRTIAGEWINSNIPKNSSIGLTALPSPWRTPPFNFFAYNLEVIGYDKNVVENKKPEYFIVSDRQWKGLKEMQKMLSNYEEIKRFEKIPIFLGLKFRRNENSPGDWSIPNPTVFIFRRK